MVICTQRVSYCYLKFQKTYPLPQPPHRSPHRFDFPFLSSRLLKHFILSLLESAAPVLALGIRDPFLHQALFWGEGK